MLHTCVFADKHQTHIVKVLQLHWSHTDLLTHAYQATPFSPTPETPSQVDALNMSAMLVSSTTNVFIKKITLAQTGMLPPVNVLPDILVSPNNQAITILAAIIVGAVVLATPLVKVVVFLKDIVKKITLCWHIYSQLELLVNNINPAQLNTLQPVSPISVKLALKAEMVLVNYKIWTRPVKQSINVLLVQHVKRANVQNIWHMVPNVTTQTIIYVCLTHSVQKLEMEASLVWNHTL